jgi:hypothetical protein
MRQAKATGAQSRTWESRNQPGREHINLEADNVRFRGHNGLKSGMARCPRSADFVAKVGCWRILLKNSAVEAQGVG